MQILKTLSTYYIVCGNFYDLTMTATIGLLNIFHKYMCIPPSLFCNFNFL